MAFLLALVVFSLTGLVAAEYNCGFYHTNVGNISVTVLSDGTREWDLEVNYPDVHPEALRNAAKSHARGKAVLYFNVVYLDTGTHKVLIDTGNGLGSLGQGQGKLLDSMMYAGLDPTAVDTVIISHAHPDHIGGVIKPDGYLAFPNAKYYMGVHEVDFWEKISIETPRIKSLKLTNDRKSFLVDTAKSCIAAIKYELTLVYFDYEIVPGVTVKSMVGETPGQIGVMIRSGYYSALFTADLLVSDALDIENPEWNSVFVLDPTVATTNRFRLLERLALHNTRIFAYHLPFPGIGRIVKKNGGYVYRYEPYEF